MMARRGLSDVAIEETAEKYKDGLNTIFEDMFLNHVSMSEEYKIQLAKSAVTEITTKVDPSARGIYTRWIARLAAIPDPLANPFKVEQAASLSGALHRYDLIKPLLPDVRFRDINFFKSVEIFYDFMSSIEDMEVKSIRQRDRDEEDALLERGDAKIVYDDDRCKVIRICSADAAILFGRGTKWCLTTKNELHFNSYIKRKLIYFVLLKGRGNSERYALAIPHRKNGTRKDWEFRNAINEYASLPDVKDAYPMAIEALEKHAEKLRYDILEPMVEVSPERVFVPIDAPNLRTIYEEVFQRSASRLDMWMNDERAGVEILAHDFVVTRPDPIPVIWDIVPAILPHESEPAIITYRASRVRQNSQRYTFRFDWDRGLLLDD